MQIKYCIIGLGFIAIAVIYDFNTDKIPNKISITGALIGVIATFLLRGPLAVLESLAGICIPVLILFILHRCKFLGAGDIKLLALAGSYLGFDILFVIFFSFIFGGVISVIRIIINFFSKSSASRYIHFSLSIFISYIYVLITEVII